MRSITVLSIAALVVGAMAFGASAQTHIGDVTITGQGLALNSDGPASTNSGNFIVGDPGSGNIAQFFWSAGQQTWSFNKPMKVDGELKCNILRVGQVADTASTSVFLLFGGTNPKQIRWNAGNQRFEATANMQVMGTGTVNVLEILGGADLAEQFNVNGADAIEPGSVVCIDAQNPGELVLSTKAYDKTVAGVISGAGGLKTGMKMGQQGSEADGEHPVALTGRVYVKVDATKAGVAPGDLLTTSDLPGYAMKALDHDAAMGAIIGKAMTPLAQGETGLVLVLVSLQ